MHGCTLLALACLAIGSATAVAPAAETGPKASSLVDHPALERMTMREVNRIRRSHGRRPVALRGPLSRAATGHAASLVRHGALRHEGPDGAPFWKRLRAVNSPAPYAEILAAHWTCRRADVAEVVRAWTKSTAHRRAMLGSRYRTAGVSVLASSRCAAGVYVVDFAG